MTTNLSHLLFCFPHYFLLPFFLSFFPVYLTIVAFFTAWAIATALLYAKGGALEMFTPDTLIRIGSSSLSYDFVTDKVNAGSDSISGVITSPTVMNISSKLALTPKWLTTSNKWSKAYLYTA
jgi:hypothetical protein